jgi:hypothetical protein
LQAEHASSITQARARAGHRFREPALRGAQLLAVSGFALAQPLFDILGKNAEFFAVRGSTPSDIVLFALVVTFAPALVLLAVEVAVELLTRRDAAVLHYVLLAGLGTVFGVQALKRAGIDGTTLLIVGGIMIGATLAAAVWRLPIARTFLTILAGASFVFLAAFLFDSKVESLVFPAEVKAAVVDVHSTTPVVFLLFDEFPVIDLMDAGEKIDAKRFPNFARLARTSVWFRNTTTLSASTTVAVPVILSGNPPVHGALPVAQNYPNNLFTLLASGYRMKVTESQTRLCPRDLCPRSEPGTEARLSSLYDDARVVYLHLLAPPSLEERLPAIDESWGNFGSDAGDELAGELPKVNVHTFYIGRLEDFNRFLASFHRPRARPTLYFLHVLMPHGPWLYAPDGRVRAVAVPRAPGRDHELWWNEDLAIQAWQRHMLQTGFTDELLGRFMKRLHASGLWDKSLVVVTADHGISFRSGDLRRHPTRTNLAELAFTPLFFKLPGEHGGRVVDTHVRTPDILPTIADVLDVRTPWRTDGHSALAERPVSNVVQVAEVSAPYSAALAQRRRSLARQLFLFGTGEWDPVRFAGRGKYARLVGKRVDELRIGEDVNARTIVDSTGGKLLRALPPSSPLFPSPISGKLRGLNQVFPLAVAVNGRIEAVSPTYVSGGRGRFSLLAPDSAFRAGRNDIRMFKLTGRAADPVLHELRVTLS